MRKNMFRMIGLLLAAALLIAAPMTALAEDASVKSGNPFGVNNDSSAPAPTFSSDGDFSSNATLDPFAAAANVETTVYVSANTLKIYKSTKSTKSISTACYGESLTRLEVSGEWAKVRNAKGTVGYCKNELTTIDPNTLNQTMYVQTEKCPVYTRPVEGSNRRGTLHRNDTVTAVAMTGDEMWLRVQQDGNYGYVEIMMLDTSAYVEGAGQTAWCAESAISVAAVSGDQFASIGNIYFGQELTILEYVDNGNTAKIRSSDGFVGYVSATGITTQNPCNLDQEMYVQTSGSYLTRRALPTAKKTEIKKNAKVTLVGVDKDQYYARVKYQKKYYYMPYIFLANEKGVKNGFILQTKDAAAVYKTTNTSKGTVGDLPAGTQVRVLAGNGVFARVTTLSDSNKLTGYVDVRFLQTVTPVTLAPAQDGFQVDGIPAELPDSFDSDLPTQAPAAQQIPEELPEQLTWQ